MLDGVPLGQLGIEGINDAPSLTVLAAVTFTPDLPPADTNPAGHRARARSLDSAPMLLKAGVIGCEGGGGSIRARDDIFEFTRCHQPRLDTSRRANELEEGQQGTAGAATIIVHTFIFSQAHVLTQESTPYFLKSATWTDDLTPLLSTTGYCWKAVKMSVQQVGVLSTKRKTLVACVRTIQARRNASLDGGPD